jgi:hypothetical protein
MYNAHSFFYTNFLDSPGQRLCEFMPSLGVCRKFFTFKSSPQKPVLIETKHGWDASWVVPFYNCIRQPCPPFKMMAVTKNRNFIPCLLLLCYKSK